MSEGIRKGQRPLLGHCEWCGMPAYERLILAKARHATYHGRSVEKLGKHALVCDHHAEHFEAHGGTVVK